MKVFARLISRKKQAGFTLVEMMVAVSIFLLVVTAGIGGLITMFSNYTVNQQKRVLTDSFASVFDQMTREMRTGSVFRCSSSIAPGNAHLPQDCPDGATMFAFESASGDRDPLTGDSDQVVYRINSTGQLERSNSSGSTNSFNTLTSPDISIDVLRFHSSGNLPDDGIQPSVTILMSGSIALNSGSEQFTVQSTVTPRLLDVTS